MHLQVHQLALSNGLANLGLLVLGEEAHKALTTGQTVLSQIQELVSEVDEAGVEDMCWQSRGTKRLPRAPDSMAGFVTFPWDRKCAKGQRSEQRSV